MYLNLTKKYRNRICFGRTCKINKKKKNRKERKKTLRRKKYKVGGNQSPRQFTRRHVARGWFGLPTLSFKATFSQGIKYPRDECPPHYFQANEYLQGYNNNL